MAGNNLGEIRPTNKALNLNDLAELEEKFGSLDSINFSKVSTLRYVLWLVLKKEDVALTLEQVGERFDLSNLNKEIEPILEASGLRGDGEGKAQEE
jgi:hypothetical protein